MNTRIKEVRVKAGLSQPEFAERLNLTKNFISLVETGMRKPSDRTVSDICREFGVNEEWLRNGTGEMFAPMSREEEIAEIITNAMKRSPEEERDQLIKSLTSLSDAEILLLAEIIKRMK